MCGRQHRQQQVQESQYIRSGSLYLRILPGNYRGQSSHPLIKLNIQMKGKMLIGSTDSSRYRSHKHPVRKFIFPDIARYCIYRGQSSHPQIKLNIQMEGKMLVGSTDSSRYRSHSTSGPEVYLSGYCQVIIEDSPLIH